MGGRKTDYRRGDDPRSDAEIRAEAVRQLMEKGRMSLGALCDAVGMTRGRNPLQRILDGDSQFYDDGRGFVGNTYVDAVNVVASARYRQPSEEVVGGVRVRWVLRVGVAPAHAVKVGESMMAAACGVRVSSGLMWARALDGAPRCGVCARIVQRWIEAR